MKTSKHSSSDSLTLLRKTIRRQGSTQIEIQETMGWGRGFISDLLKRKRKLRLEHFFGILEVIDVEPVDFFRELYRGSPTWSSPGQEIRVGEDVTEARPSQSPRKMNPTQ